MALPSISGCLGVIDLRPSLGRHASGGPARLFATMQDIWMSLHSTRSRSTYFHGLVSKQFWTSQLQLRQLLHVTHLSRSCWLSSDTGHCDLSPLRGRHTNKASLSSALPDSCSYARRSGCLYTTIKTMTQFFFSFWSIKPTMLSASMLGDYSTSASLTPSCLPRRTDLLGNPFLITSLLDLFFHSSLLLYHHTDHPARHDARILLMSASSMPSNFFLVVRSIGSLLPIGRHLTSLRSARLQTGRLPS
jgi:hypothetical protein